MPWQVSTGSYSTNDPIYQLRSHDLVSFEAALGHLMVATSAFSTTCRTEALPRLLISIEIHR